MSTNSQTPLKAVFVVGYAISFISALAVVWSMGLERPVMGVDKPSMVWMLGLFVGLYITSHAETRRIRRILGSNYPTFPGYKKILAMAAIVSVVVLAFALR